MHTYFLKKIIFRINIESVQCIYQYTIVLKSDSILQNLINVRTIDICRVFQKNYMREKNKLWTKSFSYSDETDLSHDNYTHRFSKAFIFILTVKQLKLFPYM